MFGAAQYRKGTDFWARDKRGCLHGPDFGEYITEDRFRRVGRYLARGPEECDEGLATDPWCQFRWMLDGFNSFRKREFSASAKLNPDETMLAWKGKSGVGGLPHLSFVKRKPGPLGLELKTCCDGQVGVLLWAEI